jgi:hypothetical protein
MKAYLCIRDTEDLLFAGREGDGSGTLFGIDRREGNFVRIGVGP